MERSPPASAASGRASRSGATAAPPARRRPGTRGPVCVRAAAPLPTPRAWRARLGPRLSVGSGARVRNFRVLTLAGGRDGVGKTTLAVNLAVAARSADPDREVLVVGLEEDGSLHRVFAPESEAPKEGLARALLAGSLRSAIRPGRHGVHWLPGGAGAGDLERRIVEPGVLSRALAGLGWSGLVIVDAPGGLGRRAMAALAACDLALVPFSDLATLEGAVAIAEWWVSLGRSPERLRLVPSLVDLRIRYRSRAARDVLELLRARARDAGLLLLESWVARSPRIEGLATNPSGRIGTVLHDAPGTAEDTQLRALAEEVWAALDAPSAGGDAARGFALAGAARGARLLGVEDLLGGDGPAAEESAPASAPRSASVRRERLARIEDLLDDEVTGERGPERRS